MNHIDLYYLPKQYKGINAKIANIITFTNKCHEISKIPDAQWKLDKFIQSLPNNISALGNLLEKQVIFKVMNNGWRAKKEKKIHQVFREFPHRNIIKSLCSFQCKDKSIKWLQSKDKPDLLCDKDGDSKLTIIIQEYLPYGDYNNFNKLELNNSNNSNKLDLNDSNLQINFRYELWKSSILQILFTSLELFEKFGFIYEDWCLRNILIDTTESKRIIYKAFGKNGL